MEDITCATHLISCVQGELLQIGNWSTFFVKLLKNVWYVDFSNLKQQIQVRNFEQVYLRKYGKV